MANTFELIASSTVGAGGTGTVTFSSIPATYTDLVIKYSSRSDLASEGDDIKMILNGSTASVYSTRNLKGNGSTAFSQSQSGASAPYAGMGNGNSATSSTFGNSEFYIPNYTSTTTAKSASADGVSENNGTSAVAALNAYLWNPATQAAITTIALSPFNGTLFLQHSTFYLYGVKNA
jgi:hypothetical protein